MDGAGGTYGGEEKYVEDLVEGILKEKSLLKNMSLYEKIILKQALKTQKEELGLDCCGLGYGKVTCCCE